MRKISGLFIILLCLFCSDFRDQANSQSIIIYGDSRTGYVFHRDLIKLMRRLQPVAVFNLGDLVHDGTDPALWEIFNEITFKIRQEADYYPVLGNHDMESSLYFDNFVLPNNEKWYSVEYNNIHFIILDSNTDIAVGSEQYTWLEQDLANVGNSINFIFALFHHPIYTSGRHDNDEMGFQAHVIPLLEKYHIEAMFAGHDHNYQRAYNNETIYIVSGGGGAPLYSQRRNEPHVLVFKAEYHFCELLAEDENILVRVISINNKVIDQFSIQSRRR